MTSEFTIAVHALVFLAHNKASLSSEALAGNICTNPARIRKVMTSLKKAGLISTKEGADGGYELIGDSKKITLCAVGKALDAQFVCSNWHSGDTDLNCMIASGMAGVMDGIFDELNMLCRNHLEEITIYQIEQKLTISKEG